MTHHRSLIGYVSHARFRVWSFFYQFHSNQTQPISFPLPPGIIFSYLTKIINSFDLKYQTWINAVLHCNECVLFVTADIIHRLEFVWCLSLILYANRPLPLCLPEIKNSMFNQLYFFRSMSTSLSHSPPKYFFYFFFLSFKSLFSREKRSRKVGRGVQASVVGDLHVANQNGVDFKFMT